MFLHKKLNENTMRVVDNILAAASEFGIEENWCFIENQSTFNAFIVVKYLSNIRDATDGQYICVYCNEGLTYTNNIGDLPGYPKG